MSQPTNPYAPPSVEADADPRFIGTEQGIRRDGDVVVIPIRGAIFPNRCVVCNQPAVKRLSRKLYWHPPYYYALICAGVLVYAIVALIVRKNAQFEIGLCDAHAKRRLYGILIGWIGFFGSIVAIIAVSSNRALEMLIFVFLITMIASPIVGLLMAQVVTAKRIDPQYAHLKVGRPFLDSL